MSNKYKIWALAPKGISHSWIAARLHIPTSQVTMIAKEDIREDSALVHREDAEVFRQLVRPGDTFKADIEVRRVDDKGKALNCNEHRREKVTIEAKYPFIAITDHGAFSWGWLLGMIKSANV